MVLKYMQPYDMYVTNMYTLNHFVHIFQKYSHRNLLRKENDTRIGDFSFHAHSFLISLLSPEQLTYAK